MEPQNTYHNQFAAVVKITLRDGEVSDEEKIFLSHLANTLKISTEEYEDIMQNYLSYPLEPTYTYHQRLESLYTLTKLIHEDDVITGEYQTVWLERMALAIGFTPGNVKYIIAKSLALAGNRVDIETYKNEIININK